MGRVGEIGEREGLGSGAPKETSLQSRFVLGSIPRYIKSPPGGSGGVGRLIVITYYLLLTTKG